MNVKEGGRGRRWRGEGEEVLEEEEGAQIMKIVPELDFLNHCMSLFLLIEDNYRILIFFM